MSAENIFEIMEVSKQASKIVGDSSVDGERNSSKALLWILWVVIYINYENNRSDDFSF